MSAPTHSTIRSAAFGATATVLALSATAMLAIAEDAPSRVRRLDGTTITPAEIDGAVTPLLDAAGVPGVGIAILNDRKIAFLRAYGQRDRERHLPLTPDSVMTAASFSKSLFACAVMQLVQEGVLDLDRPVQSYLPKPLPGYPAYADLAGDRRYAQITARMLLSHTAGFPNLRVFNDGRLDINFEPGSRYAYSGEGIQLLQMVIEAVTRTPLRELMRARIFEPFGMTRTSMVWEPAFESDYANGHDERGRSVGAKRRTRADAAGSAQTTLADFARFLEGLSNGRGMAPSTRALMLTPQIAIHSRRQFPTLARETTDRNDAIRLSYGLGWGLFFSPAGKAFFKEGHDDGFQHYAVMFDERGTGMVIMSNSSNAEGIFEPLLEGLIANTYTPFEWEGYVRYDRRPPLPALKVHRQVTVEAAVLDAYVGRYKAQGQPAWTVTRAGAQLEIVEEGDSERMPLVPVSDTTFYCEPADGEVQFERAADGRVTGLVARVKGLTIKATRVD